MRRNYLICIFSFLISFVFFSCEDKEIYETFFKGTVVNALDHKPFPNLEVCVTNGESTYKTTHTDASGEFSILVRFKEINSSYYLLVGDSSCSPVKKELRGLGRAEIDLGVIEIEGPKAPMVTTDTVYSHKAGTVVCRGTVSDVGRASILDRGICWSKKENPTVSDEKKNSDTNGEGQYEISIDNLELGTTYYFKAYAKNRIGISYGEQISFTTGEGKASVTTDSVFSITATSAKCACNVTGDGDFAIVKRGICWALTNEPTDADNVAYEENPGLGSYICSMRNLTVSTPYYVRAFVKNESGAITYGKVVTFDTKDGKPKVSTVTPTSTATSLSVGGSIIDNGGFPITERGFCYSTNSTNPTINDTYVPCGQGDGTFTTTISGLAPSTRYYIRAYAKNQIDVGYGESRDITTKSGIPTLSLGEINNITTSSAIGKVTVTNTNGATLINSGICWSASNPNPTRDNSSSCAAGGLQVNTAYACNMTGLASGTSYYVCAYATTDVSTTIYSTPLSFTTLAAVIGIVKDESNQVVPYASIVFKQGKTVISSLTTNAVGEFSCLLAPGNYNVIATAQGYSELTQGIYVDSNPITLTMKKLGVLVGVVYDDDNIPLANATITVNSTVDNRSRSAVSNSDGSYRIEDIPLGQTSFITSTLQNYRLDLNIPNRNIVSGINNLDIHMVNTTPVECTYGLRFDCTNDGQCGTSTTETFQIKNNRQKSVSWSLSGLPQKGISFSPSNGTIAANSSVTVTATFTYPGPSVSGSVRTTIYNCTMNGQNWTYTYLWNWAMSSMWNSCTAQCTQNITATVGGNTSNINVEFFQYVVWR